MSTSGTGRSETVIGRLIREIQADGSLTLHEVGKLFPDSGRKAVSYATVLNWVRDGVRAPSGQLVRLEALQVGSRRITTAAAVERFLAARSEWPTPEPTETALAAA